MPVEASVVRERGSKGMPVEASGEGVRVYTPVEAGVEVTERDL